MFAITISEKGGESKRLDFDKPEITIGRVQGNDIILPKGNVSKRHSRIVLKDGKFIIVDLKSTNGTYVNGRKISSPIVIKGSDKVYIGDFVLAVEDQVAADPPTDLPPALPPPAPRRPTAAPPPPPRRVGPEQRTSAMSAVDADAAQSLDAPPEPPAPVAASEDEETPPPVDEAPLPPPEPIRPEAPRPGRTLSPAAPPPPRAPPRPTVMGDPGARGNRESMPAAAAAGGAPAPRPGAVPPPSRAAVPVAAPPPVAPAAAPAPTPPRDRAMSGPSIPPARREPPAAEPAASVSAAPVLAPVRPQSSDRIASLPVRPAVAPAAPPMSPPPAAPPAPSVAAMAPAPERVPLPEARPPATLSAAGAAAPPVAAPAHIADRNRAMESLRQIVARLTSRLNLETLSREQLADAQLWQRADRLASDFVAEQSSHFAPGTDVAALAKDAVAEALGNGPIDGLLADLSVTEINVPRFDRILVVRGAHRVVTEKFYSSPEAFLRAVTRLTGGAAASHGVIEARLADGALVTAIVEPLVHRGAVITVRRVRRDPPVLGALATEGMLSPAMADFLALAVRERRNILITGTASAGRSTLISALAHAVDSGEHLVLLEDRDHESPTDGNMARLTTRAGARETLAAALRLHPDRLIVDDNHGQAAAAALEAMVGLPGTIATAAGLSAVDGVSRFLSQARLAPSAPDAELLREALSEHLHLVVHVARSSDGKTRVTQIAAMEKIDSRGRATLASIFFWKSDGGGSFGASGHVPSFAEGAPPTMFKK